MRCFTCAAPRLERRSLGGEERWVPDGRGAQTPRESGRKNTEMWSRVARGIEC